MSDTIFHRCLTCRINFCNPGSWRCIWCTDAKRESTRVHGDDHTGAFT